MPHLWIRSGAKAVIWTLATWLSWFKSWRYKKGGENISHTQINQHQAEYETDDKENKPQASTTLESMITYRFQWLRVSVRSPSIWIVYLFIKTLLLLLPNSTDFAPETHHFGCSKYIPDHEPLNFCGTPAVYNVTPVASHLAARFMRGNNGEKKHNLSKWIIHIILHPLTWKLRLVWGSYPCYTIMEPMTSRREVDEKLIQMHWKMWPIFLGTYTIVWSSPPKSGVDHPIVP
jgi:hypothetical protein